VSRPRFGVFGGSFNPPHAAHLALARLARDHLRLDTLFVVPTGDPWQKARHDMQPAQHRLAMAQLAFAGEPRIEVDRLEIDRSGPSYTLDTLQALQARHPGGDWFLVIGQDQYARFDTWHAWPQLLTLCTLAVAARAGEAPQAPPALQAVPHRVAVLPLPDMPVSATDLRARLARGEAIAPLVAPAVAGYIAQHHLYARTDS
jgi:nicotinate-nucleotide adenylyltransferase